MHQILTIVAYVVSNHMLLGAVDLLAIQANCWWMQVMLLLTHQHARPDIPEATRLPGPAWSGTAAFIELMQASPYAVLNAAMLCAVLHLRHPVQHMPV